MTTSENVIAGIYLALFLMLTAYRNEDYASHVAIWTNAAVQSPTKARPSFDLGAAYFEAGKLELARLQFQHVLTLNDPVYEKAALSDIAALDIAEHREIDGARLISAMKEPTQTDLSNFALVLVRNGLAKDALTLLRGISDMTPVTKEVLAEAYQLTNDCADARPLYDDAAKWGLPKVECR